MDVLAHMRVFRKVVERDSFSKAALDLNQSAAAISKQVRQRRRIWRPCCWCARRGA